MIHIAIVEDESLYLAQLMEHIEAYKKESGQEIKISTFRFFGMAAALLFRFLPRN